MFLIGTRTIFMMKIGKNDTGSHYSANVLRTCPVSDMFAHGITELRMQIVHLLGRIQAYFAFSFTMY